MNGDFFEKMWGFLKNSGGDKKWGYLEAEWGFSPKNIWQHCHYYSMKISKPEN